MPILLCFILLCFTSPVTAKNKDKSGFIATAMIFSSTLVAPPLLRKCKKKASAWIFLGSAAYLLASEIISNKKHIESAEKQEEEYRKLASDDNKQAGAAKAVAKGYDKAPPSGQEEKQKFYDR